MSDSTVWAIIFGAWIVVFLFTMINPEISNVTIRHAEQCEECFACWKKWLAGEIDWSTMKRVIQRCVIMAYRKVR